MTKKTLQLLASAALVAGLGFTTITANADATSGVGSQTTTAKVTLDSKGSGDGGNVAGKLALTSAPDVTFAGGTLDGTNALDLAGTFEKGANSADTSAAAGAVTVVDPGTASGWNVQVKNTAMANDDSNASGASAQITGGNFTFSNAVLASSDGATANAAVQDISDLSNKADTVQFNTEGTANQNIFHAESGNGVGTWANTYNAASLHVPAGNAKGSYTSTLTWTLTNTPENK